MAEFLINSKRCSVFFFEIFGEYKNMNFKKFAVKWTSFLLIAVMLCCSLPTMVSLADDDDDAEYMTKEEAAQKVAKNELFTALYNGIKNCEEIIDLSALNCTEDDLFAIWDELCRSAGLFHHYAWDDLYNFQKGTNYLHLYAPAYYWDIDEAKNKVAEYDQLMAELISLGSKDWSDLEIIVFYHDYLVANYAFDTNYEIYDGYGFLKEKKGLEQSYTMIFEEIMAYYGIPCTYAESSELDHIWNVVYLDGYWYHLDLAHDDPLRKKADVPGCVSKKYFLLGSDQMEDYRFEDDDDEDFIYGCDIIPAEDDHPSAVLWKTNVHTPILFYQDDVYSTITVSKDKKAYLCKLDLENNSYSIVFELPYRWDAPSTGAVYLGSYTTLCTDGNLIYYNTPLYVKSYNPKTGEETTLATCDKKTERIYALQIGDGVLKAYTAKNAESKLENYFTVELPILVGDLDGDQTLTISDVTHILSILANDPSKAPEKQADINEDGVLDIYDVTSLLSILAG